MGIANRIFIRIYSEFGRTPLNSGNGKDHHSVGTQILMEATPPAWGNRVFGASGPRHQQVKVDPATGAVDPVNGKVMAPRHVHAAMRKYLGIQTSDPKLSRRARCAPVSCGRLDYHAPAFICSPRSTAHGQTRLLPPVDGPPVPACARADPPCDGAGRSGRDGRRVAWLCQPRG
jgi:hypothetical protein